MRKHALHALSEAFHGRVAQAVNWLDLIELANAALVTPSLGQALANSDQSAAIPADVVDFIAMVTERNNERNERLLALAADAIAALNSAGITPVLLKGAALLTTSGSKGSFLRIMSDVDLLVRPDETPAAMTALATAGFQIHSDHRGEEGHAVADLWRQGDVGMLDLHQHAPGPRRAVDGLLAEENLMKVSLGGEAWVPTPTLQVFLLCIHDQFHDGGFWRGGFDLRHLCDIAALSRNGPGIDWDSLDALSPTRLMRNAVHSQLAAAGDIANSAIPEKLRDRWLPRLHYHRHRAQSLHPRWRMPLAVGGMALEAPNLLQHARHYPAQKQSSRKLLDRLWRMGRNPSHTSKV